MPPWANQAATANFGPEQDTDRSGCKFWVIVRMNSTDQAAFNEEMIKRKTTGSAFRSLPSTSDRPKQSSKSVGRRQKAWNPFRPTFGVQAKIFEIGVTRPPPASTIMRIDFARSTEEDVSP